MSPQRHRPRTHGLWSLRNRFVATILLVATLGLGVAGSAAYLVLRQQADRQIDEILEVSITEFEAIAYTIFLNDRSEGDPIERTLRTALTYSLQQAHEGALGYVDTDLRWYASPLITLRLEDDQEFVDHMTTEVDASLNAGMDQPLQIRTVQTTQAMYRYTLVPLTHNQWPTRGTLVLAVDRDAYMAQVSATFSTYLFTGLGTLVILVALSWWLGTRALRPIRDLRETANEITETDLSRRIEVVGRDELAHLTATVNHMLERVERGVHAQRQLLRDVSHELRTPLTIVQGNLELLDPGDPADVRATSELASDEIDRMSRLLDDLSLLAATEENEFLQLGHVDVAELTDEVYHKALGFTSHTFELAETAHGTGYFDRQRITQAWLQLIANAVKYAPEGSLITLSSRTAEADAGDVGSAGGASGAHGSRSLLVSVQDRGPGVPRADQERIFERFTRLDRDVELPGSGLGLALVAAIAHSHGGEVLLESIEGEGSRFTLRIPLYAASEEV